MATVKRQFKNYNYTDECKQYHLNELLNQTKNWEKTQGINGTLNYKNKEGEKSHINMNDNEFPDVFKGQFTHSLYTANMLDVNVLREGNVIQIWKSFKLKQRKILGRNFLGPTPEFWHLDCIIWAKKPDEEEYKPYSFGVAVEGEKEEELDMVIVSPSTITELNLARQKLANIKNEDKKFFELLAMGFLNTDLIDSIKQYLENSETKETQVNTVMEGFNLKTKKQTEHVETYETTLVTLKQQRKNILRQRQSVNSPIISKNTNILSSDKQKTLNKFPAVYKEYTYGPIVLSYSFKEKSIEDKSYCRLNTSRNSSGTNCMGMLDTILKDIFSCRLFGKLVIPSLCGPKKECVTSIENNIPLNILPELGRTGVLGTPQGEPTHFLEAGGRKKKLFRKKFRSKKKKNTFRKSKAKKNTFRKKFRSKKKNRFW